MQSTHLGLFFCHGGYRRDFILHVFDFLGQMMILIKQAPKMMVAYFQIMNFVMHFGKFMVKVMVLYRHG